MSDVILYLLFFSIVFDCRVAVKNNNNVNEVIYTSKPLIILNKIHIYS